MRYEVVEQPHKIMIVERHSRRPVWFRRGELFIHRRSQNGPLMLTHSHRQVTPCLRDLASAKCSQLNNSPFVIGQEILPLGLIEP